MSIKDLFRQTSNTVPDLQAKYKSIQSKKTDLEKRADDLRCQSLKSDADVSEDLGEIREEILLAGVAMAEIRKRLESMLSEKIESDYQGLDADRQEYEQQRKNLCERAGKNIGRGVQNLETLNFSFAHVLSRLIREEIVSYSTDRRFADQLPIFLAAYQDQINSEADPVNFRSWKKELQKVEQLKPGSAESKRHVEARVKRLLTAN